MAPDLEETFDAFVRARGEHFLRVALLLTGSPTEAEDLLQASLLRLYRAWPRLDAPESAPDAYLRKILVNTRRSWWRTKWRQESPVAAVPDRPDPAGGADLADRYALGALVPAGAVAALGGAAALGLTLTTTVASAPSAFAAVTAAAAKTSAQSFRVTEIQATKGMPAASGHDKLPPPQITGGFDPEHGLGEEIVAGRIQVRFVGGHMYAQVGASPLSHGKPWVETPTPPPPFDGRSGIAETFNGSEIAEGFYGNEPIDPAVLLGLLKSAGSVRAAGPVSGPGWTGTKYVFTIQPPKATAATYATSGIVYVDNQGRVRRLMTIFTWSEPVSPQTGNHVAHTYTHSFDVTFGDFGVPVSVTAPPASQVYNFSGRGLPAVIWLDILG